MRDDDGVNPMNRSIAVVKKEEDLKETRLKAEAVSVEYDLPEVVPMFMGLFGAHCLVGLVEPVEMVGSSQV